MNVYTQDIVIPGRPHRLFLTGFIMSGHDHAHIKADQPLCTPQPADGDAADRRYRVTVTVEEVGE